MWRPSLLTGPVKTKFHGQIKIFYDVFHIKSDDEMMCEKRAQKCIIHLLKTTEETYFSWFQENNESLQ